MSPKKISPDPPQAHPEQHRSGTTGRASATRRRGATLERALLEAAWDELQASGYTKLTMERVAERAGTSRAVIYRRWRNRSELAIAALRHHQPVLSGTIPDTGSLRGDTLAVLSRATARITAVGPDTIVGMLGDLLTDKEAFDQVQAQLLRGGSDVMASVLARAAARGEVREDISPRVARLPLDLLRYELILTHQPPSQHKIDEIVDDVFLPLVLALR
jgi:AcrR family transcriptional regulator